MKFCMWFKSTESGGKRRAAPGERPHKPLAAWAARRGGKRRTAPGESAPEPLAARATCRGGKRRAAPGDRPPKLLAARPEHGQCSPRTATSACSAPPSPQQDWTELANLSKRSPPPACVREEIRHRRDGEQKPNKQREPLQKGLVQKDKIPEGNTDYTGRGL